MGFFPGTDQIDHSQKPPPLPPKKPGSQLEATMALEPDEDSINMVIAMLPEVDRKTAIRYLKAKLNDVGAAVNAMLDREDISKVEEASTWDESAWSTDREGGRAEQYLHPLGAPSAAATRPNSPASSMHRQQMHPTTKAEEDEDLAKAMEMSQADIGVGYIQETGRVSATGQETTFGPATRGQYDERNWSVVPFSLQDSSDEVVPDLEATDRVNAEGQPRLLKHLPEGDYTPAFLMICHAISGVREALLLRDHVRQDYGEDGDWWRGHAIALPQILHVADDGRQVAQDDKHDELIAEVQRIMAFLTSSDRSYASVGALMQTSSIADASASAKPRTLLDTFMQQWTTAATLKSENKAELANLFATTVGANRNNGTETSVMNLVDLPVSIREDENLDLFESLDELLWDSDNIADPENVVDTYIETPADVVVVRAYQQSQSEARLRLQVPSHFFIDKYLLQNVQATRSVRTQTAQGRRAIATIERTEAKLRFWKHPHRSQNIDAKQLLVQTLGHYSGQTRAAALAADKSYTASVEEDSSANKSRDHEIAQKLGALIANIESKLEALATEKTRIRKAISEAAKAPLPGQTADDLKHRYTLRGVATKPNITYLLRPKDPFQDNLSRLEGDDTPEGMQWWRLEYEVNASGSTAKVTKTPTADYDVLRAAELEHRSALLVYVNDRIQADIANANHLPPPLETFVSRDNSLFQQELSNENTRITPTVITTDVSGGQVYESIEASSRASMDSTRVHGSMSPILPAYDDVDMLGHSTQYALGYDMKQGHTLLDDEPPVHEIRLPDDEGISMEMEMVERRPGTDLPPSNASMMDIESQDDGLGGASHIEDVSERR